MILQMGGGGAKELAIKVLGGTVQPTGASGILWCNTATAVGSWTIDSATPASPAEGNVWIEVSDRVANTINVLRHNAIMARIKRVWQYVGGMWVRREAYYHDGSTWALVAKAVTIMGVRWSYGASSPLLARLEDAFGLTSTAGVGATAGSSDFDDMPIYSDIRLCNLADNGTVNAYQGEAGFVRDGTNGQVMVEIPAHWYKVVNDTANSQYSYYIADAPQEGYMLHPMFAHNGAEQSHVYVAAYETGSGYVSNTGVAPLVNVARNTQRTGIRTARGTRWSIQDLAVRVGISWLMIIEYATMDLESAIGAGIVAGSAAVNTGGADNVAGSSGRAAGTDNLSAVVWRGIQNWWGHLWHYLDGVNTYGGATYVCLTQSAYAEETATGYTLLGYTTALNLSAAYGTRIGYDAAAPWASIPSVHSGGSSSTYLCDACWSGASGIWGIYTVGGYWGSGAAAGPWAYYGGTPSYSYTNYYGSRMMYVPAA